MAEEAADGSARTTTMMTTTTNRGKRSCQIFLDLPLIGDLCGLLERAVMNLNFRSMYFIGNHQNFPGNGLPFCHFVAAFGPHLQERGLNGRRSLMGMLGRYSLSYFPPLGTYSPRTKEEDGRKEKFLVALLEEN